MALSPKRRKIYREYVKGASSDDPRYTDWELLSDEDSQVLVPPGSKEKAKRNPEVEVVENQQNEEAQQSEEANTQERTSIPELEAAKEVKEDEPEGA